MKKYEFTLYLDGLVEIEEKVEDRLFGVGCSDGMLGMQNGTFFIDFVRQASSFYDAVLRAVKQIEKALPLVRVSGIDPSPFLTQSQLARLMDVSREYVRLLSSGERGRGGFPAPVISSEKQMYWDVSNVLQWFSQNKAQASKLDLQHAKDLVTLFLAFEIRNNRDEYKRAMSVIKELDAIK